MEQKDYLLYQIEQLSFILKKILSNILSLNCDENAMEAEELVSNELKIALDFDLHKFKLLSKDELKNYISQYNFNENHFEELVKICLEMSSKNEKNSIENQIYLNKAFELLQIAEENSGTYSFERNLTKIRLQEKINAIKN